MTCMVRVPVGDGRVYYCGTNLGEGASANGNAFGEFIESVCRDAGVTKNLGDCHPGVHTSFLGEGLLAVHNTNGYSVTLPICGKSVFHDSAAENGIVTVPAHSADILVIGER